MVVDEAGRSRKLVKGLVDIRHELVDAHEREAWPTSTSEASFYFANEFATNIVDIRHELVDEVVVDARKGSVAYLHERSLLLLRQRVRDQYRRHSSRTR